MSTRRSFLGSALGVSLPFAALAPEALTQPPQDSLDVRDFGAIPDGRTDASAAFQAAIQEAAGRGGGEVHFRGIFALAGMVRLASGVTLRGAGPLASVLVGTGSDNTMILAPAGVRFATVRDCGIDGRGSALVGLHFEGATDCVAERVHARQMSARGHCLYMSRGAARNVWRDCLGDNGPASSLILYNNSEIDQPNVDNWIIGCIGRGSAGNQGLEIRRSHRTHVIGCRFEDNAQTGLNLEDGASGTVVVGCQIRGNGLHGLNLNGTDAPVTGNVIQDCVIEDNEGEGAYFLHAPRNILSSCRIARNRVGVDVRWETPASDGVRVESCQILDNASHGVLFAGVDGGSVTGGESRNNRGHGVLLDTTTGMLVTGVDARGNGAADIQETGRTDRTSVTGCQANEISVVGANSRVVGCPGTRDR